MRFPEIKAVRPVYFPKYALRMFVCFLIFFLIYNCKEIREGDVLIQKVSKGVPLLVKTQK